MITLVRAGRKCFESRRAGGVISQREVRSAAKKLVGPAPRPDQVQLAALQAVLDTAEQPLSEREQDAVDAALAHARGAFPPAAPLLSQGKCPTLASTVLSFNIALSNHSSLVRNRFETIVY